MLCVDGSDITQCIFALAHKDQFALDVVSRGVFPRTLGDELRILEEFLRVSEVSSSDISMIGLVHSGGSAGALRSVLSLMNSYAIVRNIPVYQLRRDHESWSVLSGPLAYALPAYDKPSHTTPSQKDALGRKRISV